MKGFAAKIKGVFGRIGAFFQRIGKPLTGLRVLTMMQLKERLGLSFKADPKKSLTKSLLYIILVVAVTAILYVVFYLLGYMSVFAASSVPISLFNTFFIFMYLLQIFSCLNGLTDTLYFSRDNQVLLTYPVKPNTVFYSKLIVYYVSDLVKNFTFIIPLFVAYGMAHRFQIVYYPWLLFCFLFISAIPVAISGLLSVPYMWIKMLAKRYPLLQNGILLAVLIAITALIIWLISFIPPTMNIATAWSGTYAPAIKNFCKTVNSFFPMFTYLVMMTMGDVASASTVSGISTFFPLTAPIFFIFLGILIALFVLTFLLVKPFFFRMASVPFEIRKKIIVQEHSQNRQDFIAQTEATYFRVKNGAELSEEQRLSLKEKLESVMNRLRKDEDIFFEGKIDIDRVLTFLERYAKMEFEASKKIDDALPFYAISNQHALPSLILAVPAGEKMRVLDPFYSRKKNRKTNTFLSMIGKDVLVDLRSSSSVIRLYLMMVFAPIVLVLLNTVFNAMTLNDLGKQLVPTVNIFIIMMIFLGSNVDMASVYSREGQTAYLAKTTPANYASCLFAKLITRAVLMTISLTATMIIFRQYVIIRGSLTVLWLGLGVFFFYIGHLVWSAELDYMNPQDKLYAETGENASVSNPNETLSTIIAFLVTLVVGFFSFLLLGEKLVGPEKSMLKIAIIGFFFCLFRVTLFLRKIRAYTTSRGERGRE